MNSKTELEVQIAEKYGSGRMWMAVPVEGLPEGYRQLERPVTDNAIKSAQAWLGPVFNNFTSMKHV